jgi:hypothetical protein
VDCGQPFGCVLAYCLLLDSLGKTKTFLIVCYPLFLSSQMLGNLARPSYQESTQGIWPWSYDTCGASQEAVDANKVQKLSNCQYGKGRGSPEIDIIEAQPGDFVLYYDNVAQVNGTAKPMSVGRPMISSSLQVSPGVANDLRPMSPALPVKGEWYPDFYPMVNIFILLPSFSRCRRLSRGS